MEGLRRLAKFCVWAWAIVVGGFSLILATTSRHGGDVVAGWFGVLIGLVPVCLMFWLRMKRRERWAAIHAEMLAAAGGAAAVAFEHGEDDSGIAVNPGARTVTLLLAGSWKTYPFADVRKWRTTLVRPGQAGFVGGNLGSAVAAMGAEANMRREAAADTGLFVEVRDVDRPKWRVAMRNEAVQARWMEILNQEINESRPEASRALA